MNGPEGTIFALNIDHPLDEEHTFAFSLAILPNCKVIWSEGEIIFQKPSSPEEEVLPVALREKVTAIKTQFVGVNGGPEAAKEAVCRMIDQMWEQVC